MVLESLLYPVKAEQSPWRMLVIGVVYNTIAIFLALWIFKEQASFAAVFFTVLAAVPIMYNTMRLEEAKDLKWDDEKKLLHEHNRAIMVFGMFFIGVMLSSVFWYTLLPGQTTTHVFSEQIATISRINNHVSAGVTGLATGSDVLFRIFFNNLKVLIFCVLFAFVYGAGAVFILTWNASVIATAIGNTIRTSLSAAAASVGAPGFATYFSAISYGFLRYSLHGIPEVLSYLYAGIAGGIISVGIMRGHFSSESSSTLVLDVGELLLISLGFLVIGAIFEVYLTPALF